MIKPTIGRVVLFHPAHSGAGPRLFHVNDLAQPCAAIVSYVWDDRRVNLAVFDHNGESHSRTSVQLVQEGDPPSAEGEWCEWMPYQKGQAARTEQLERQVSEGRPNE